MQISKYVSNMQICLKYANMSQICKYQNMSQICKYVSPTLPQLDPIPAAVAAAVDPLHPGGSKNRDIGIAWTSVTKRNLRWMLRRGSVFWDGMGWGKESNLNTRNVWRLLSSPLCSLPSIHFRNNVFPSDLVQVHFLSHCLSPLRSTRKWPSWYIFFHPDTNMVRYHPDTYIKQNIIDHPDTYRIRYVLILEWYSSYWLPFSSEAITIVSSLRHMLNLLHYHCLTYFFYSLFLLLVWIIFF